MCKPKFVNAVFSPPASHQIYVFQGPIATSSCSGQHGCRNIRDGGETTSSEEPGPFLVYILNK